MEQSLRQLARKRVKEATATRRQDWLERESRLGDAAVEVVAAIGIRDRAESEAARSIASMLELGVSLTEVGERCGLPLKEVVRLKRVHLEASAATGALVRPVSSTSVGTGGQQA
jgi:cyanate lyase